MTFLEKKILGGLSLYEQKGKLKYQSRIDSPSVTCITDQDFALCKLRKRKVQQLTDSNTVKYKIRSRKLLSKYTQNTLQAAFSIDEKIFKVKQWYNSHNNVVYVLKKMRKVDVPEEKLICKIKVFFKQIINNKSKMQTSTFLLNRIQWTDWQKIMGIYLCKEDLELTQPSSPLKSWRTRKNLDYWSPITGYRIVEIRSSKFWDLGTPWATHILKPRCNRSQFFKEAIVEE